MSDSENRSSAAIIKLISLFFIVVVIPFILLFFVFGKVVPPDSIGIRQNKFSLGVLNKGYQEEGLSPGLHWKVPYISDIILVPRGFQIVTFDSDPKSKTGSLGTEGIGIRVREIDVPTTDGSKVKTDITLVVRRYEEPLKVTGNSNSIAPVKGENEVPLAIQQQISHGGPKELVENFQASQENQLQIFSRLATEGLIKRLSSLSTTEFYNPVKRETATLRANEDINQEVAKHGFQLWATLVRRYLYSEANIDNQIFAKNLQDATERLNTASSTLAEAEAETEKTRAEWDAKIKDLNVEGSAEVDILRSEGELYEQKKKAEGDLLVAKAKAEISLKKAEILDKVEGSEVYIAKEMAPLLATLSGGVVSGIDPFDLNKWMEKMVGEKQAQEDVSSSGKSIQSSSVNELRGE